MTNGGAGSPGVGGSQGQQKGGAEIREAGAGPQQLLFPSCFPVVPLSSTSSCFKAIKFFPGEIRGPARPTRGLSRVLGSGWEDSGTQKQGAWKGDRMKTQPCALWGHHSASAGSLNRESWVQRTRQEQVTGSSLQALSPSHAHESSLSHFSTSESPAPPQTLFSAPVTPHAVT